MGILDTKKQVDKAIKDYAGSNRNNESAVEMRRSDYQPDTESKNTILTVIKHFADGYNNLWKPRREFNDLSCIDRMSVDQMMWNTYQTNDSDTLS